MRVQIILNPYANRWRAQSKIPQIEEACTKVGLDYDLFVLPSAGQGKKAAIAAVESGYDVVVAAGGDGTVNEVLNGLIAVAGDGATPPLGVIPLGTGNDFNDMNHLPRVLLDSVSTIAKGNSRQIDAGLVVWDGHKHYFGNNCALAMEPMVTIENVRITRISGNLRYLVALVKALVKLKAWDFSTSWDAGKSEGPMFLLSVCNSPRTGGIFPMAPNAQTDDGQFDVVSLPEVSKMTVLKLLPRLLRGTHINYGQVSCIRTPQISVSSSPGTPIHADGEVLTDSASEISFEVLPKKITLISK
jgi:diacylglycerol kinase (ATP)